MNDEARVAVKEDGGSINITGGGTLAYWNAAEFGQHLADAARDADDVTVDLRDADFIDTQIVQDLGRAAVTLLNRGKRLKLVVQSSGYPLRVMQISSYDQVMDVDVEQKESR